ncbi:TPA: hypothetical protein ACKMUH_001804 [Neisseria gonorrhoeae]|uniref:hypothetical protein n=1 Tax=Neisseria gonorrhoeae TaxID=485 RepID=UPI000B09E1C1|nr:hypothetical protein [Neisseria gonorrhoeae]UWT12616.1 hypothetical protein NC849_07815 [Neisseria gonorrhoeae]UWT14659.1 hypothetical protein NC850_07880 [Neisseria gonorrhoeae]UWT42959.1 hypothetical protein NDQ64_07535 [Neisseria gonorrhoeae]UXY66978.1 hypothetical protein OCL43_07890 [Neisseria gonorrhoeae]UXY69024.1 hypothetical protein OCL40_07885 [Neisseria gonorrhoeae]
MPSERLQTAFFYTNFTVPHPSRQYRNPETRHSRAGGNPGLSGFGFSDRFSLRWGF